MSADLFSQKVERAFVEIIVERAEKKNFKKGEFAALVWPEMSAKAAASRWASVRFKASNTGKPQAVSIADAQRMATIVGQPLGYLLVIAAERANGQK
ncbi:immunity protein [Oleidesulfovibrio alaskensis]